MDSEFCIPDILIGMVSPGGHTVELATKKLVFLSSRLFGRWRIHSSDHRVNYILYSWAPKRQREANKTEPLPNVVIVIFSMEEPFFPYTANVRRVSDS